MSVGDSEDHSLIYQILTEDGIFALIKRFADGLSPHKKATAQHENSNAITPFKIYEALLKPRETTQNADLDYQLACCIRDLGLQDAEIKRLDACLQSLQQHNTNWKEIISFLLQLANLKPQKKKNKSQHWQKIFYCPPEMMDGSLFDQLPETYRTNNNVFNDFCFDALPGSNLPLAERFFHRYGVPVEVMPQKTPPPREQREDVGYSSSPEIDWLEVAKLGPAPPYRTWECLGQLAPEPEKPFLSESGASTHFYSTTGTSLHDLQQDLAFLAVGIASKCFPYSEEEQMFVMRERLTVAGLPSSTVENIVSPLLECGTLHKRLEEFVASEENENKLLTKTLQSAVRRFLVLHNEATHRLMKCEQYGFSRLVHSIRWLTPPLATVARLCCANTQPPCGVELLEQFCSQASILPPGRSACVLYSLLKSMTEAYFRILGGWLLEGEVDAEGASEFFVQLQPGVLDMRTRHFWTQGFTLLQGRLPHFLHGLEDNLMLCGKSLCLLKLCTKQDPLICELKSERPDIVCCLQYSELAELQSQWETYAERARQVLGPPVTTESQLEHSQEKQKEFFENIKKIQDKRVQEIRAKQAAARKAKHESQQKLRNELQQQIEYSQARKAHDLRLEQEEEEKIQRIRDAEHAEMDRRVAAEKEKMLAHYQSLIEASDKRLGMAKQRIETAKCELVQTTAAGDSTSDINSNPVGQVIDDNDNTPLNVNLVRKVPTTLALQSPDYIENAINVLQNEIIQPTDTQSEATAIYKVASSEAAKNKAKVLSQEMNLVTYYGENEKNQAQDLPDNKLSNVVKSDPVTFQPIHNVAHAEAARNRARVLQSEWNLPVETKPPEITSYAAIPNKAYNVDGDSPSSESVSSPSSEGITYERVPENSTAPYSAMTMSMESAPSLKTDLETPTGTYPSAMSISIETSSIGNLPSPSSAVTSSLMTDSKVTFPDTPSSDIPKPQLPTSVSNYSFLSALSMLSEPFKWPTSQSKENMSAAVRKLDISTSHLNHLLRQTVSVVLSTQVTLVNQSILKLFLQKEQLLTHFSSLRQYFLLVDGEFARQITEGLCNGMKEHAANPRALLNFVSLDSILQRAISLSVHGSKDPNASRLSLASRSKPEEFNFNDATALNCVQLQYQVAWPLCLVITPEALHHYDRIFSFLLGLRRGVWALDESFQWLQRPPDDLDYRLLARSSQYHQLRLYRHEMGNFVQSFHSYIMNVAILRCWKTCKTNLKRVTTLDELYKSHASFVKKVIFFCLLKQEASELQKLLQGVLRIVFKFHGQLIAHSWYLRDGVYEHPAFGSLTERFARFRERTKVLLRHMKKIADRGYQQELNELLHALNMNDYYGLNL